MSNETPTYDTFLRITPLLVGGLIVSCGAILLATLLLSKKSEPLPPPTALATSTPSAFEFLSLEARAAYVYDMQSESALFERNGYEALPLASITKLLTVIVAQSVFNPDAIITVSSEALLEEGNSDLFAGERWPLSNLLQYILITSSNDGSSALALAYNAQGGATFVTKMNEYVQTLGLSSFSFTNPTGLDTKGTWRAANFGSARDVAFLFAHALTTIPDILDTTRTGQGSISSFDTVHSVVNTNTMIDDIPNAIGSKTGFTDAAGGNLVLSFDVGIGHPVIVVVLGSSKEGRFTDVQKLADATREYYKTRE